MFACKGWSTCGRVDYYLQSEASIGSSDHDCFVFDG